MSRKIIFVALSAALILSACGLPGGATPSVVISADSVMTSAAQTAIFSFTQSAKSFTATDSPTATFTPEPPTPAPTATVPVVLVPFDALCTYPATVRSWPGKGGDSLGFVLFNRGVKVVARNNYGNWLYIEWPDSPSGYAWVTAQAFELKIDIAQLPLALESGDQIIFKAPIVWEVKGTPLPLPTLSNDPAQRPATVVQQVIVRVCPTKGCMQIGILNLGQQLIMTGRFGDNDWAQIEYPSGPNGKGWVSRDTIQLGPDSMSGLPFFDEFGTLITPEPPTGTPDPNISPTPTETAAPTPAGPLGLITDTTTVYTEMSSLSPELGKLNPKDKIYITAASFNNLWFQIQYPADSTGRAYISTKNVRLMGDFRNLPYTDARGTPFPTVPVKTP